LTPREWAASRHCAHATGSASRRRSTLRRPARIASTAATPAAGPPTSSSVIRDRSGYVFVMALTRESSKRSMPTTALTKPCAHCGEVFRAMPSEMARRRFCGQECVGASRRGVKKTEWVEIECVTCSTLFRVTPAWVKNGRRRYCSRPCQAKATVAGRRLGKVHAEASRTKMREAATGKYVRENSSQWKGGRFKNQGGYLLVMVETLSEPARSLARQMTTKKYVQEHRAVAAAKAGRPLLRDEIVHHRNGVKDDNRPENLIVVPRDVHSMEHREVERELVMLREEVTRLRVENLGLRSRLTLSPNAGSLSSR
jgi:hypothetical protein